MRKKKKRKYLILLLLLVLGVTVGYAFLSTTLNINGTSKIKNATWDIHWENPQIVSGSTVTTIPTIDSLKTTASFSIILNNPGDYYEFTIDAKNDGTIDGMISTISYKLNNTEISAENSLPSYLNYTVTYSDDTPLAVNQLLEATKKQTYKVRVEFKKEIDNSELPENEVELDLKFAVTYIQADNNAVRKQLAFSMPTGKTIDTLEFGDEICIKDECFNFIKYDGENSSDIIMLAKYNLMVGDILDSNRNKIGEYTNNDAGYGLQNSNVKGWVRDSETFNGVVEFSTTNYWDDNGVPKSEYSGSYTSSTNYTDVYDAINYHGAPGSDDYSVAYYVNQYKTLLERYGVPIKDARLITYEEITGSNVGCNGSSRTCPTAPFITTTSFWVGSAYNSQYIWRVYSVDHAGIEHFDYSNDIGLRPVVVLTKSDIY